VRPCGTTFFFGQPWDSVRSVQLLSSEHSVGTERQTASCCSQDRPGKLATASNERQKKTKQAKACASPCFRYEAVVAACALDVKSETGQGLFLPCFRYEAVVAACALDVDIARMAEGDLTPIGDKGGPSRGGSAPGWRSPGMPGAQLRPAS